MANRLQFASLLLAVLLPCTAHSADHSVLFIGNSYTSASAPYSLDESYRELILEGATDWTDLSIEAYSPGGRNLAQHLADAETEGSTLYDYLHGDNPAHQWDYVIVHDQSQIPGFPQDRSSYNESRDAAVGLADLVDARGAQIALWVTWGRVDGDSQNLWLYPDYSTMQELLVEGYESYGDAIIAAGHPATIVPVGQGWQMIHDQAIAQGRVPQDPSELFARLYSGDGSHPSILGTYLSACIIYAFITDTSPVGLTWAHEGISDQDRLTLQQTAERLLNESDDSADGDDDSTDGDDDSADGDDDSADGDDDSADEDGGSADGDDDSSNENGSLEASGSDSSRSSCGCSLSPTPGSKPWLLALLAWVLIRRRRTERLPQSAYRTQTSPSET